MDESFYMPQAQRARDLAEKADPFTRNRLLDLADRYDAKVGSPSRACAQMRFRIADRARPLPRTGLYELRLPRPLREAGSRPMRVTIPSRKA
ncbi:hypothetical protein [Bradyrhizobium sp. USDA 10063]